MKHSKPIGTAALLVTTCLTTGAATAQTWTKYGTGIQQLAAAADGTIWAYNYSGQIVKGAISSPRAIGWTVMPPIPAGNWAALSPSAVRVQLSVGSANQVFATDVPSGVVYRWTGSAWQLAQGGNPGSISSVFAASDGTALALVSGRPLVSAPCLTASGNSFDDWTVFPSNISGSSSSAPSAPAFTAIAGTTSNLWAVTGARKIYHWNSLNASKGGTYWELAELQPPGTVSNLSVGSDGSVFAQTTDLTKPFWKATVGAPCPGTACRVPLGSYTYTITWAALTNLPPALWQIAVIDQNRIWGVTSNGDVYATY